MSEMPLFWLFPLGRDAVPGVHWQQLKISQSGQGRGQGWATLNQDQGSPSRSQHRQQRAGQAEPPPATSFVFRPHTGSSLPTLRAARAGPADAASTWSSSEHSWQRRPAQVAGAAPPGWRQVGAPRPGAWGGGKCSQGTPPQLHDFADPRPHRV